jgi:hypothetical protein
LIFQVVTKVTFFWLRLLVAVVFDNAPSRTFSHNRQMIDSHSGAQVSCPELDLIDSIKLRSFSTSQA